MSLDILDYRQQIKNKLVVSVMDYPYSAKGDGVTDDTVACQSAITDMCNSSSGGVVVFPSADFLITGSGLLVNANNCKLRGEGNAQLLFAPTENGKTAVTFDGDGAVLSNCSITDITITSDDITYVKTALKTIDCTRLKVSIIVTGATYNSVRRWHDTSNSSVGHQTYGRDLSYFSDNSISADKPRVFSKNPNFSGGGEDLDHFYFHNETLIANGNYNNTAEDGVTFSNTSWGGYNSWNQGTGGIYWTNHSKVFSSQNIKLSNIRWEQSESKDGWMVYFDASTGGIQNLIIENLCGALSLGATAGTNGIYLRNVISGDICNYEYTGGYPAGSGQVCIDTDTTAVKIRSVYNPYKGILNVPVEFALDTDSTNWAGLIPLFNRIQYQKIVYTTATDTGTLLQLTSAYTMFKVTLPAGPVSSFYVNLRLTGTLTNPTITGAGLFYSDSGGAPLASLGTLSTVPFGAIGSAGTFIIFSLNTPVTVVAGDYWVGIRLLTLPTGGGVISADGVATGTGNIVTSPNAITWTPVTGTVSLYCGQQTATAITATNYDGYPISVVGHAQSGLVANGVAAPAITATGTFAPAISGFGVYSSGIFGNSTHYNGIFGQTTDGSAVRGFAASGIAGEFARTGTLTAANSGSALSITEAQTLGAFDSTGPVIRQTISNARTGDHFWFITGPTNVCSLTNSGTLKIKNGPQCNVAMTVGAGANQIPAAVAGNTGLIVRVSDALTPTIGDALSGGGAAFALVVSNGSQWTVIGK